jgi:hypothetical protein
MKRIFVGHSSAMVKKMGEVWRKMSLFGPDSVPPNQLLYMIAIFYSEFFVNIEDLV